MLIEFITKRKRKEIDNYVCAQSILKMMRTIGACAGRKVGNLG